MEEKVFFNRILQLRTENNLSQAELSEYLGITRSALSHYELGHRNLTMTSLKKLAIVFNVSIDYLVFHDDYSNHNDFIADVLGLEEESIKILVSHKRNKEINKFIQKSSKGDEIICLLQKEKEKMVFLFK